MAQFSHTHKKAGGRFQFICETPGVGPLSGSSVILYSDVDKDIQSATTSDDWSENWRPIAKNDCPVCIGTGTDQIKGNTSNPCGACFGFGIVRDDGNSPETLWELAEIVRPVIQRQRQQMAEMKRLLQLPAVKKLLQELEYAAVAKQELEWRDSTGMGAGGNRMTGD